MKKVIFIGLILVLIIGVALFFIFSSKGMYEIGTIAERDDLDPVEQITDNESFEVTENINLRYFTQGAGDKVLVIHGGPGMPNAEAWPGLNDIEGYEFIYYDQRGCGESTRPIDTFESTNYYENMKTLEEALGLTTQISDIERIRRIISEEKLIIIGHSYGGLLASLYAAEFPEQVEKLILVAPAPLLRMPMEGDNLFDSIEKKLPRSVIDNYNNFVDRYFDYKNVFKKSEDELIGLNNELGKFFYMALKGEAVATPINGSAGGWMVQALYLSSGRKYDFTEMISKVKVPTLIIHPGSDFVQRRKSSELYLEVFPHSEFVVIEDAGHMPFYDEPKLFAEIVTEFLD